MEAITRTAGNVIVCRGASIKHGGAGMAPGAAVNWQASQRRRP